MTTKITEQNVSNLANLGVQWQAVHVADGSTALAVTAGKGYFIDTTSATQAVNLPASGSATAGDTIILKDYARKWGTNAVTLGSNTFDGVTNTPSFNTKGQTVTFIHMGGTKGWSLINDDTVTGLGADYVAATGGTVATSGDFKIHTFTGDGNFVVSAVGNASGSNAVEYLVVAGGGGSAGGSPGAVGSGGGGAGGLRFASPSIAPLSYPAKPLAGPAALSVTAQSYPVSVGGGGAGTPAAPPSNTRGAAGSVSTFSTITSAGGGGGGADNVQQPGGSGGSGGGGSNGGSPGAGNTPPVSPAQGTAGGTGVGTATPGWGAAGGGGAIQAGQAAQGSNGGYGGDGAGFPTAFGTNGVPCGSYRYYSGGAGGGSGYNGASNPAGAGGKGGGGAGKTGSQGPTTGNAGTANTGGGGGGIATNSVGGTGGKGVVIIRYKFQN